MKFIRTLILIVFCLPLMAKELTAVYFQPRKTTIVGIIETQTFPGPPGYESIAQGDKIESGWYLKLQNSVNVLIAPGQKPMDNDTATYNVKVIQMVIDYSKPYKISLKKGNVIKITGRLFSQLTGHHHARVLIEVENIEVIK